MLLILFTTALSWILYCLYNGTEIIKFKAKDSEIVATPLSLGKIADSVGKISWFI